MVEDRAFAGGEVVGQAPAELLPQGRRHDQFGHLPPQHVGPPVAEGPFGSRVELHDLAFVVDGDDAVQGRVHDGRLAGLALPQGDLGLPLLRHVPEGEDHADRLALLTPDRGRTVVNGPLGPVPGEQYRMVAQADDDALPNHLRHRVLDRPAGLLVQDGEYRLQRLPLGLFLAPAGQGFGHRVEERHPAFGVRGDDRIANADERDPQPLPLLPQGLVRPLALGHVPEDDHQAGDLPLRDER